MGEKFFHETRTFEELQWKKSKLFCQLIFLRRCRNQKIILRCVKLNYHQRTRASKNIWRNTSYAHLRSNMQQTRRHLDQTSLTILLRTENEFQSSEFNPGEPTHQGLKPPEWLTICQITNQTQPKFSISNYMVHQKFTTLYRDIDDIRKRFFPVQFQPTIFILPTKLLK